MNESQLKIMRQVNDRIKNQGCVFTFFDIIEDKIHLVFLEKTSSLFSQCTFVLCEIPVRHFNYDTLIMIYTKNASGER